MCEKGKYLCMIILWNTWKGQTQNMKRDDNEMELNAWKYFCKHDYENTLEYQIHNVTHYDTCGCLPIKSYSAGSVNDSQLCANLLKWIESAVEKHWWWMSGAFCLLLKIEKKENQFDILDGLFLPSKSWKSLMIDNSTNLHMP